MLILFDIDLTLITTQRAGLRALEHAGRQILAPDFSVAGIDFAGRLDPLIIADMLARANRPITKQAVEQIKHAYASRLPAELDASPEKRALAGVPALLSALRDVPCVMGVLTGNFQTTGELKLRACGIDPALFAVRAYADEAPPIDAPARPVRADLVPVALRAYRAHTGKDIPAHRVVVVGDTPHDVACARAHDCRCIAVATGLSPLKTLQDAGADIAFPDLADTARVLDALHRLAG